MSDQIALTVEQEEAVAAMLSGRNVFLTGEAGTGKSTVVREFCRRRAGECVILAPTGIAALNAGGSTIHSFFLLRPGLMTVDSVGSFGSGSRIQVLRSAKTVIIDEASMVRSDLLSAVDIRLRQVAGGAKRLMPFGGKQVVLVGDFFQLPPVVRTEEERDYLDARLGGAFAFQADLWVAAQFACVCLKTVHRQGGDARFLAVLNALRHGRFEAAASVLNETCCRAWTQVLPPVCLCMTNRDADTVNRSACKRIGGTSRHFAAVVKDRFPESDFPTDADLELVVGARVMLLCNRRTKEGELEFANGDMGVVTGFEGDGADAAVRVRLDKGGEFTVETYEWKNLSYVLEEDPKTHCRVLRQCEVGSFEQIPLRLAYAVTVHKAQGLSLDRVYLRLGNGCFSHGQLYTALSRCRSLSGLRLDRPVRPEDLIIDDSVMNFYSSGAANVSAGDSVISSGKFETPPFYEEAMRYYLRQIDPAFEPVASVHQFELSFESRVKGHPDLESLAMAARNPGFNKYDAPVLDPILRDYRLGNGVTESQLAVVSRLIRKYVRGNAHD